jgi:hypothetical protein
MPSHRARAAALIATLALPLAGCGGGGTDPYALEYTKAAKQYKQSVDEARAETAQLPRLRDRVPALMAIKTSTDKFASDLEDADPPGEVAKLNARAVAVLHRFSGDLERLKRAATAGDRRGVDRLAPRLQTDQAELQDVLDQIDQRLGS